jgi:hypothetical protein
VVVKLPVGLKLIVREACVSQGIHILVIICLCDENQQQSGFKALIIHITIAQDYTRKLNLCFNNNNNNN